MAKSRKTRRKDDFIAALTKGLVTGFESNTKSKKPSVIPSIGRQSSSLYALQNEKASPEWLYSSDDIGEIDIGQASAGSRKVMPDADIDKKIDINNLNALLGKNWMDRFYNLLKENNFIQRNEEVGLLLNISSGVDTDLTFGGAFLKENVAKIGGIVQSPPKVNLVSELLSHQNMEFYRGYTGTLDVDKYIEACLNSTVLIDLLNSNIEFYREYLDGVIRLPLKVGLVASMEQCTDQQITFKRAMECLIDVYLMTICKPNRIKPTANMVIDNDYISIQSWTDKEVRFIKQEHSRNVWRLVKEKTLMVLNPAAIGKRVFGRRRHSYQRSNTNKLLGQLGVQGLIDSLTIDRPFQDYSETFTSYYLDLLGQPLNNLTTIQFREADKAISVNTTNDMKKMAVVPVHVFTLDNVVYALDNSIPMNAFTEGRQTNIELHSQDQINYFTNELFKTDNYGYPNILERNMGDDMFMGLQVSAMNKANTDSAYNEILSVEQSMNHYVNKIIKAAEDMGIDRKEIYLKSIEHVQDMIGTKSILDKYTSSSLNFPEYMPDGMLSSNSVDIQVPSRACGFLNWDSHSKNMTKQVTLSFSNVLIRPDSPLYKFLYSVEVESDDAEMKVCIDVAKQFLCELLNKMCDRDAIERILYKLEKLSRQKDWTDAAIMESELKSELLDTLSDVACVTHLTFLADIARDLFTYHYTRLLNLDNLRPVGLIVGYDNPAGYNGKNLGYYSFIDRQFWDISPVMTSSQIDFPSNRVNLLTTGLFSDVLSLSACHGYRLNNTELENLDEITAVHFNKCGLDDGQLELYYKSFYDIDTVVRALDKLTHLSGLGNHFRDYSTILDVVLGYKWSKEPNTIFSRATPQLNKISYTHLMLGQQSIQDALENPSYELSIRTDEMYSRSYLNTSKGIITSRYDTYCTKFQERYMGSDSGMPDYNTLSYIDETRLSRIAQRYQKFEGVLVKVLIGLIKEIETLSTADNAMDRCEILNSIFECTFIDKLDVINRKLEGVNDDILKAANDDMSGKHIPNMEELVMHVLSCDSYFK